MGSITILRANAGAFSPRHITGCDLPAPGNYHATNVGATFVDLQWNAGTGVHHYELKVQDGNFANVITLNLPGTATSATVTGLQMGTNYTSTLIPYCSDNEKSSHWATTTFLTIIIVDLILDSPAPNNVTEGCTLTNAVSTCGTFPWVNNAYQYFKIKNNGDGATFFRVYATSENCGPGEVMMVPQVQRVGTNENDNFIDIIGSNNTAPAYCGNDLKVVDGINYSTVICQLTIQGPQQGGANVGTIYIKGSILQNYSIVRMVSSSGGTRGGVQSPAATSKAWAVNPFSTQLDITLPPPGVSTDPTTLALFDISGKQVKSWQCPGTATECILPTADLLPGLYFLHIIAADGHTQTLKVIKA